MKQRGRPHFFFSAETRALCPPVRLELVSFVGAARGPRGGWSKAKDADAASRGGGALAVFCPWRWRQRLQTNPPKMETLGCSPRVPPVLSGSEGSKCENLSCALGFGCDVFHTGG